MDKAQEETYFPLKYRLARFLFLLVTRPFVRSLRGLDHLPQEGAFIAAANHCSLMDGILIGTYATLHLKRHMHFLSTTKYYNNPFLRWITETTQSIWRKRGEESRTLLIALEYLKEGKIIAIFPEGGRSINGRIGKAQSGIGALVLASRAPVVPIGLIGTNKVFPAGSFIPHLARCEMNIGEPLNLGAYYPAYDEAISHKDQEKMRKIEEETTRVIMREIARLSKQEYSC